MAGIDKIYGTQFQYNEFKKWLKENQKPIKCRTGSTTKKFLFFIIEKDIYEYILPTNCLYGRNGYNKEDRPISNFPEAIDKWLLKKCPIKWVTDRIKEQYNIK